MSFFEKIFCCGDAKEILDNEEQEKREREEREAKEKESDMIFNNFSNNNNNKIVIKSPEKKPEVLKGKIQIKHSRHFSVNRETPNTLPPPVFTKKKSAKTLNECTMCPEKEYQVRALDDTPVIDNKYLFKREIEVYESLSTRKIIEIFSNYENLDTETWIKLCDSKKSKHGVDLWACRDGSEISVDSYLTKLIYTMKKEDIFNPELELDEEDDNFDNKSDFEKNRVEKIKELKGYYLKNVSEYFDLPVYRLKWDKGIRSKQTLEILECETENVAVKLNYTIFKSPLPFVDDRSVVDKNISFYYNNDFYIFCSSVDKKYGLELCPIGEEDKNVRAWSILNMAKYTEDADNVYLTCYYQIDYDVVLSDAILQPLTAATIPSFYKKFNRFLKEQIMNFKKNNNF